MDGHLVLLRFQLKTYRRPEKSGKQTLLLRDLLILCKNIGMFSIRGNLGRFLIFVTTQAYRRLSAEML